MFIGDREGGLYYNVSYWFSRNNDVKLWQFNLGEIGGGGGRGSLNGTGLHMKSSNRKHKIQFELCL